MRTVFFIAVAVAVDAMINSDSRKRFLRVSDPEDDDLTADDEERVKFKSMSKIIAKLERQDRQEVANILRNFDEIHVNRVDNKLKTALQNKEISEADYHAVLALMKLSN
ncbi:hypothetical protein PR003_g14129 [Phytophthora rubi]|uniref:RxLR effector protein n=1 Tax=Phytophthora rubi TaxID=129364 RepID=A0A6A4F0C6_9STRA|nr:hypothetical protein PR002_g14725 [Phytophthora rubi]KAE9017852.1 hypothetical protein PR001_g14287 [Phytophthora rubi]KAE9333221.1 hypothetical protein PR003_g14129 [Phytophthora rubi]